MNEPSESDHDLLIRIDEKVRQVAATMETRDIYHKGEMDRISLYHKGEMDRLGLLFKGTVDSFTIAIGTLQTNYVTRSEMTNHHETLKGAVGRLERLLYGGVGVILLAFIGALVALVFRGGAHL